MWAYFDHHPYVSLFMIIVVVLGSVDLSANIARTLMVIFSRNRN